MEPIAKRLKSFLQFKGLTTTAFTRTLQYNSCEKVARLFRVQGAKPSVDILEDIAKHFEELNLRWLITGQGEMLCGSPAVHAEMKTEPEQDAQLVFMHTANGDEYHHRQGFSSFLVQTGNEENGDREKVSKPLLGSLANFIDNLGE